MEFSSIYQVCVCVCVRVAYVYFHSLGILSGCLFKNSARPKSRSLLDFQSLPAPAPQAKLQADDLTTWEKLRKVAELSEIKQVETVQRVEK